MIERVVTSEMWLDWKKHPVTNAFMREITLRRENLKEDMARGGFGDKFERAIGAALALSDVLNVELQTEEEEQS